MDIAESLVEILKFILPAGLVLLGMRLMQQQQLKEKKQELEQELHARIGGDQRSLLFHAYERVLLFIARTEPDQLLNRVRPANLDARQYAMLLDQNIREEFDHNLAQQLYILPATWNQVLTTQVAVRGLIAQVLQSLPEDATGKDLYQKIWKTWASQEQPATLGATKMLKQDVQKLILRGEILEK